MQWSFKGYWMAAALLAVCPAYLLRKAAEIYQAPTESMLEHARLRAEAMTIRDTQAERGALTEDDWARINELLRQSWESLFKAVNE